MEAMVHQGRNIKKLREMLGIKQETLASEFGLEPEKNVCIGAKRTNRLASPGTNIGYT